MSKSSSLVLGGLLIVVLAVLACDAESVRRCPSHETYFKCGANCQTECSTLGDECLIQHIRCPDGCYCNKGFARDASHKCIPISKCPPKQ